MAADGGAAKTVSKECTACSAVCTTTDATCCTACRVLFLTFSAGPSPAATPSSLSNKVRPASALSATVVPGGDALSRDGVLLRTNRGHFLLLNHDRRFILL